MLEAMEAATELAKEAWDRWIKEEGGQVVDDITVVSQQWKGSGLGGLGAALFLFLF